MNKLLLIDGHSIMNRAYYGIPLLTNYEGIHTNAIHGFIRIMLNALEEEGADHIAVAFDLKAPTFRHKKYADYKGTRSPMPEELREQIPLIKEILKAMNIPVITLEGYEADDILGTLSKRAQKEGYEVAILSGDRDLLQLADEHIHIRLPKTVKGQTIVENYTPELVKERYQVTPEEFIDLKALMGDASDNIPGVPGIGEKTATQIIVAFHSIENAHEHIDQIMPKKAMNSLSEHYDMAVLSKELATICLEAPLDFSPDQAAIGDLYTKEAYSVFERLELKNLLKLFPETSHEETGAVRDISETFITLENEKAAYAALTEWRKKELLGLGLAYEDGDLLGYAVADGTSVYYLGAGEGFTSQSLKEILKELEKSCRLAVRELKSVLDAFDSEMGDGIDDISLMCYLLNPLKEAYDYDDIGREYCGLGLPSRRELSGKQNYHELHFRDIDSLIRMVSYEACVSLMAHDKLVNLLHEQDMYALYHDIELPIVYVLRSMEREGIGVNREALEEYGKNLDGRILELEQGIYSAAGEEFNINSPKQLGEILFGKMHLPSGKKTKTGYSTSADVLEKLAEDYPVVKDILEYRTLTKLKSTYALGLADYIREDGRIHGTFNQTITATGRLSSTEPNLQNIPIRMEIGRQIRKVFIPKEGYSFIDADYSQIELRLLAHMSGDESLIEAYNEDSDIHRITASKVFHVPLNEVTSAQRSNAKAVNFGIVYGISSFGLSNNLSISKEEAKQYIEDYFKTFGRLKEYQNELVDFVKEHGYSVTLYGRRRPVPEIRESNFMRRQFGERIAMNSPLQGTAADIIKIAMIRVYKRLKEENRKSRLILQIHDELLIETAPGEEEAVFAILREEMSQAASLRVRLEVDAHQGKDWYEAK